jgi:putative flippase GtrA
VSAYDGVVRSPRLADRSGTVRRFAAVGMVNTAIDLALFEVLHTRLGIVGANVCSTSAGMTFSYLANGRYTFGVRRRTAHQAALFVACTGTTMWVVQPLVIEWLDRTAGVPLAAAKLAALAVSVVVGYRLARWVIWPPGEAVRSGMPPADHDAARVAGRR